MRVCFNKEEAEILLGWTETLQDEFGEFDSPVYFAIISKLKMFIEKAKK